MKIKKFIQFSLIINLTASNVHAQIDSQRKLLICTADAGQLTKSFIKSNNIPNIEIFYNNTIDPQNQLQLNELSFTKAITKSIPDVNSSQLAVIDWEGPLEHQLAVSQKNTSQYQTAINEYLKAIRLAKKIRPNVKWGFFGLPFPDQIQSQQVYNNLDSLLTKCDVLFPSFYIPFNTRSDSGGKRTIGEKADLVTPYLAKTLTLGKKLKKKVFVFIWNRYYSAGFKQNSLTLIPLKEFTDYVNEILKINRDNQKIDGVVLWDADLYYYNKKFPSVVSEFVSNQKFRDFNSYHDNLLFTYLRQLNLSIIK